MRLPSGVTAALAALVGTPWGGSGQEGLLWRPEERSVYTAFHRVGAVTRDEMRLYAASDGGLLVLDLFSERWDRPSTGEDGYPVAERPSATAFDPLSRVVWLGTAQGNLHTFQVDLLRWELETSPGLGPILRISPYREGLDEGVYVLVSAGWYRIPRFGGFPEPVRPVPPALRALEASAEARLSALEPAYAAARGTATMGPAGRSWPVTDFAGTDRAGVYWLATAGGNLFRFDARTHASEHRAFGLLTPGALALAQGDAWIWIGGDGRGPRRGLVRADHHLEDWEHFESGVTGAPPDRVLDILVTQAAVWLAATSGLWRRDVRTGAWSRVGGLVGAGWVLRVAPDSGGGVWAATERGLWRVGEDGTVRSSLFGGRAVRALARAKDHLWVGGDVGLVRLGAGGEEVPVPGRSPPQGPFVDLAVHGGELWAATARALWRFDGLEWSGPNREVVANGVLDVVRIRSFEDRLWVAGTGGVAVGSGEAGEWRYLRVGPDIPSGPVADVLVTDEAILAATPGGVVRLDRRRGF